MRVALASWILFICVIGVIGANSPNNQDENDDGENVAANQSSPKEQQEQRESKQGLKSDLQAYVANISKLKKAATPNKRKRGRRIQASGERTKKTLVKSGLHSAFLEAQRCNDSPNAANCEKVVKKMDTDGSGKVDKMEATAYAEEQMQKVFKESKIDRIFAPQQEEAKRERPMKRRPKGKQS